MKRNFNIVDIKSATIKDATQNIIIGEISKFIIDYTCFVQWVAIEIKISL